MMRKNRIKLYLANRSSALMLIAITLVFLISVGTTLAVEYTNITEEFENVFMGSENIRARLSEPNWNAPDGLRLVPGKKIRKDPIITNTGNIAEYVAIQLTFLDKNNQPLSNADLLKLFGLIDIDWNLSDWKADPDTVIFDNSDKITDVDQPIIFYYQSILMPARVSEPLFSSIRVHDKSDGLSEAELRWLQGIKITNGKIVTDPGGLGEVHIKIEGAAVQAFGFNTPADAQSALKAMFP